MGEGLGKGGNRRRLFGIVYIHWDADNGTVARGAKRSLGTVRLHEKEWRYTTFSGGEDQGGEHRNPSGV